MNKKQNNFKLTNLKFFLFDISTRRNFIPILSIYFLTLANTTANQIWIFSWLAFIAAILLEVPSWYFADNFWHKKTLVLSKIFQASSVLLYILWYYLVSPYNFYIFVIASIFQTAWFAFFSWTKSAFYHELLETQDKEKKYSKYAWKMSANVSLASVLIIFTLPFLTIIHILLPFIVWIVVDIIWMFILLSIPNPNINHKGEVDKNIFELFSEAKLNGLLPISIFTWLIMWVFLWEWAFRTPYLESLWYPLALIGMVMAVSRIVWYFVWHHIHKIEKYISMKQHFFIEIFLFSSFYFLIILFTNPYLVWLIISIFIGYKWGRQSLINWYLFKDYIKSKKYKATFLSMSSMLNSVFWTIVSFWMWYLITIQSYRFTYAILWLTLFILLSISYYFTFIKNKRAK